MNLFNRGLPWKQPSAWTDRKVGFLLVGAQKSGTTALSSYLSRNNYIYIPKAKEVHFFDNEDYDWDAVDYSKYHVHFASARPGQLCGEATPITMWWRPAMQRVYEYNPNIRILVILRNPITRAYSHWNMEYQRGAETLPFLEAIQYENQRCRQALPRQHRVYSYISRGFYSEQLREIWRLFPKEQVHVLRQEDLLSDPVHTISKIEEFLGVKPSNFTNKLTSHKRSYPDPMPEEAVAILKQYFTNEIAELQCMLNWNCSDWLNPD